MICDKITYTYCVTNEFDQLLRFKTWETRLFKMPRLKTPRLVTGTRIAVASELSKPPPDENRSFRTSEVQIFLNRNMTKYWASAS